MRGEDRVLSLVDRAVWGKFEFTSCDHCAGFHTNWSMNRLIWLICVPSFIQKDPLSEIIWWDSRVHVSHRVARLILGFQNHPIRLQLLWVVICSHLVVLIQHYRLAVSQVKANNHDSWSRTPPFPQSWFHSMNNALIGMKILIYLMEEHLVPFPELIGSTKHEIKQHMSGCKVIRIPTTAEVWILLHIIPLRLWSCFSPHVKPCFFFILPPNWERIVHSH